MPSQCLHFLVDFHGDDEKIGVVIQTLTAAEYRSGHTRTANILLIENCRCLLHNDPSPSTVPDPNLGASRILEGLKLVPWISSQTV